MEEQKELMVDATIDNLQTVIGFVEEQLEAADCPMKTSMLICVSLEEIYVNVVNYAYGDSVGKCEISSRLEEIEGRRRITLSIKDKGKPFNPLDKEDPDITLSADERRIGGLGIYMVKNSMDDVKYDYISGHNIFSFSKSW